MSRRKDETEAEWKARHCATERGRYWANRQAKLDYQKQFRTENPDKCARWSRIGQIRRKFGITEVEYNERLALAGGKCAICARELPLNLDHNHKTGALREFLCTGCNTSVAVLEHEMFPQWQAYLERHHA